MDDLQRFQMFLGGFSLFIAAFGAITNVIVALVIVLRKSLRETPTFVFIAFISVFETIPLLVRNLNNFTTLILGFSFENRSESFCLVNQFFHYFSVHTSTWILITMSVERFLSIRIKTWRTRKFNAKKAVLVSLIVMTVFIAINFCINFTTTFSLVTTRSRNTSIQTTRCVYNSLAIQWTEMSTYVYSIVPFIILAIVNCLLIYDTVFQKSTIDRSSKEKSKRRSLTILVSAMTLSFIIMTAPIAILTGYFMVSFMSKPYGGTVMSFFSILRFSYYSCNLIVLILFNKKFSSELKFVIKLAWNSKNNKIADMAETSLRTVRTNHGTAHQN